jgi:hypothetical protein
MMKDLFELVSKERLMKAALDAGLQVIYDGLNKALDGQDKLLSTQAFTDNRFHDQLVKQGDSHMALILKVLGGGLDLWDTGGLTEDLREWYAERIHFLFETVVGRQWEEVGVLPGKFVGLSSGLWSALELNLSVRNAFRQLHSHEEYKDRYFGQFSEEGVFSLTVQMGGGQKPPAGDICGVVKKVAIAHQYKYSPVRNWEEDCSNRQTYDYNREALRVVAERMLAWNDGSAVGATDRTKEHGKARKMRLRKTESVRSFHKAMGATVYVSGMGSGDL